MNTDDRAWDAAASDRFNATFDRGVAEIDLMATFRRLLAEHEARGEHVDPVVIDFPPDLDPADRDALIDVARGSPSVIVVDHGERGPKLHHAIDRGPALDDAFARLNTALDHLPPQEPPVLAALPLLALAAATGGLQSLPRVPTKAPKPPPDVQDAIQAAAEDRRDRKRVRNLRNIGHSADCAMDMAIGHRPCSCAKAWGLA